MAKSQPRPVIELAALMQQSRLARIIELLWENKDKVIGTDKVQVIFDCAGSNVEAKITFRLSSPKK